MTLLSPPQCARREGGRGLRKGTSLSPQQSTCSRQQSKVPNAGLGHLQWGPQRSQRKGGKPGVRGRLTGHAAGLPLQGCSGERAAAVALSIRPWFYSVHLAARRATNATPQTSRLERKEKKVHISRAPTEGWGGRRGKRAHIAPAVAASGQPSPRAWLAGHASRDEPGPSPRPLAKQGERLARISFSHIQTMP